ncbi:hypothetical protein [uncultured virus]|uniref:Uncharacterized protein n=1 Tax=uncultured virus TaxID=340016 RepID=A0A218MN73_9VIRU|nr:hypothetical protein [uncultured virus]
MAEKEEVKEKPEVDNTVEKQKIKKKTTKKFEAPEDNTFKVDLNSLKEAGDNVTKVDLKEETKEAESVLEEVVEEKETTEAEVKETPVLEEIKEGEVEEIAEVASEAIKEQMETGVDLPENVQKLMDFMEDTGGDLNDYVKLNRDYSDMDNQDILYEHYKQTKPHLNTEEINFLLEDQFSFDEDVDDEKDIRRKKLALKEQVASAKAQLEENKSKYYEEIKAGSKLTEDQQKAIDFFNRYNEENAETEAVVEKQKSDFMNKTNTLFNDKFKGFEYNVGDKNYRFNVNDVKDVKNKQSDINNFVKKFLNKDGEVSDAKGYHKSLYTAMNSDAIAKHFYEQGKADAMKDSITNAKNIDMSPRQSFNGEINAGGMKVKVLGNNSDDFKFKIKSKK